MFTTMRLSFVQAKGLLEGCLLGMWLQEADLRGRDRETWKEEK